MLVKNQQTFITNNKWKAGLTMKKKRSEENFDDNKCSNKRTKVNDIEK